MLRLIILFLVFVTRIHTNYLANQKNNPKMKNNIMFICMYVCMYVCIYVWTLGIILKFSLTVTEYYYYNSVPSIESIQLNDAKMGQNG